MNDTTIPPESRGGGAVNKGVVQGLCDMIGVNIIINILIAYMYMYSCT